MAQRAVRWREGDRCIAEGVENEEKISGCLAKAFIFSDLRIRWRDTAFPRFESRYLTDVDETVLRKIAHDFLTANHGAGGEGSFGSLGIQPVGDKAVLFLINEIQKA